MSIGRPTKLTLALQRRICKLISETGCSVEGAAAACDLDPSTLYDWRSRGLIEGEGPFAEFSKALQRAREKSEPTLAACIARAAKDDWKAALAILERRFPERWGNQITIIRRFNQMSEDELDAYIAGRLADAGSEDEDRAGDPLGAARGPAEL